MGKLDFVAMRSTVSSPALDHQPAPRRAWLTRGLIPILIAIVTGVALVLEPYLALQFAPSLSPSMTAPHMLTLAAVVLLAVLAVIPVILRRLPLLTAATPTHLFLFAFAATIQLNALALSRFDVSEVFLMTALVFILPMEMYRPGSWRLTPMHILALAFFSATLASATLAIDGLWLFKTAKAVLCALLLFGVLYRTGAITYFLFALAAAGTLNSLFCLFQEVVWVAAATPVVFNIEMSDLRMMFEPTAFGAMLRTPGLTTSYHLVAGFLGSATVILFCALRYAPNILAASRRVRLALWLACAINGGALLLTFAKDAIIGVAAGLAIALLVDSRRARAWFIAAALASVVAAALYVAIDTHRLDTFDAAREAPVRAEHTRLSLNRQGLQHLIDAPPLRLLLGRGVGKGYMYTPHCLGWPAHNAFILCADDLGLVGFTALLLMYAHIFWRVVLLNSAGLQGQQLFAARCLIGLFLVVFVSSQFTAGYIDLLNFSLLGLTEAIYQRWKTAPEYTRIGHATRAART